MFILQQRFLGSHGKMANQFFGGIGTYSQSPYWVNLIEEAVKFETKDVAETVLGRIHSRRAGFEYSVVAVESADETGSRP